MSPTRSSPTAAGQSDAPEDIREARLLCVHNARLGIQTHPVAILAALVSVHLLDQPVSFALSAFVASLLVAVWRWWGVRHLAAIAFDQRDWRLYLVAPTIAANLIWSLLVSAMLWSSGLNEVTMALLLGSIALAFGCTRSFMPARGLAIALLLLHLAPPMAVSFARAEPQSLILGLLFIAFQLYILRIADAQHDEYWKALRDRRRLTAARQQAEEANRAKDQFLANISHEIRTPLNGIAAPVELLQRTPLSDEQQHYVSLIESSSRTLMQLIGDLLDVSKLEAGKLRLQQVPFALQQLVRDVTERHQLPARQKGVRLQLRDDGADVTLLGDPLRIGQIVDNLLSNAVKFTDSGSIEVRVEVAPGAPLDGVTIAVHDTGRGIPAEVQASIFEPFVQAEQSASRRQGGTGLGLNICRQLAELMGGGLQFDSVPGRGSCFMLQLALPRTTAMAIGEPRSFPGLRVLVAEDNSVNQQVIRRQLQLLGIEPVLVGNGHEVLAAVQREQYDLILLDCQMPGLDGYETAERLRALGGNFAQLPIIALTAHAMESDMQRALSVGMSDYLSKPVSLTMLSDTIGLWAERARQSRLDG
jgi:signal transduction histidine kinase/ActR/RegA family two-component response regulator